jgi:hypothetical protein
VGGLWPKMENDGGGPRRHRKNDGGGPRRNWKNDGGWLVRKNDRAQNGGGQNDGAGLRTVVDGGKKMAGDGEREGKNGGKV